MSIRSTYSKVDDLAPAALKYWTCAASGAIGAEYPGPRLLWPSDVSKGRCLSFDPTKENYSPWDDPQVGIHLKLRDQQLNVDWGTGDLDTRYRFVLTYDREAQIWICGIADSLDGTYQDCESRGSFYESVYRAIVKFQLGLEVPPRPITLNVPARM